MASGVKWIQGSPERLISTPSRVVGSFRPRLYRRMENVIDEAVKMAQQLTATRPTAKSGKGGRVETGAMMNDIVGRVWQDNEENIVGEFGFLDHQEFYYFLQTDTGFQHYLSGEFIEPTFALRDAAAAAFANLMRSKV